MDRILVTGGGGFIGSHLCEKLIEDGNEVIVIENFCSSSKENIQGFRDSANFSLIDKDVLDDIEVEGELDYVMHLASRASPKDYQENPIHTLRTNTEGTLKMFRIADEKNAKFLFTSTSEVYGDPEEHPQTEDYWGHVNPVGPRACYDEGKRCGEAMITSYARENELDYRIVRIFNTYGPRLREDDGRVISNFITQALNNEPITVYGDGSQTRSFCYVEDLVRGLVKAKDSDSGEIFNLGNPDEYTILELAELVQEIVDIESEIVHEELPEDDPSKRKPDVEKAKRNLNWAPKVELREGLRGTKKYFRESK